MNRFIMISTFGAHSVNEDGSCQWTVFSPIRHGQILIDMFNELYVPKTTV